MPTPITVISPTPLTEDPYGNPIKGYGDLYANPELLLKLYNAFQEAKYTMEYLP